MKSALGSLFALPALFLLLMAPTAHAQWNSQAFALYLSNDQQGEMEPCG